MTKSGSCRIDKRVLEMYSDGLERRSVFRALKDAWRFSISASGNDAAAGELGKITDISVDVDEPTHGPLA